MMVLAIELAQPLARVPQSDPGPPGRRRCLQADAIVTYLHNETVAPTLRKYLDVARTLAHGQAVPDGVLHQRLEDEVRYHRRTRVRVDVQPDHQPLEARALDVDVRFQRRQFL